jgi:hypothetical protein
MDSFDRSFRNFDRNFNIMKFLIISVFILVALSIVGTVVVGFFGGLFPNYSDGERSGTVYKVSHKGFVWKSYEGEMNLGGMAADANGQMTANTFKFSVRDPSVVEKLNEAASSGKRVTLHYTQYAVKPLSIDTPYVVDSVKGIGEK